MKKRTLFILTILLLTCMTTAAAGPAAVHSAYRLSFQGNMTTIYPEPGGRWVDELLGAIDLRAEHITWQNGEMTRLDFIVDEMSAASLVVLRLEDEMYLSGSLFPEVPFLFYENQQQAARALSEAFFPPSGTSEDTQPEEIDVGELIVFLGELSKLLDLAAFPQEATMYAFIETLDQMALNLEKYDADTLAVTIERRRDDDGVPILENIQHTSDVAVERLLHALMTAIAQMV